MLLKVVPRVGHRLKLQRRAISEIACSKGPGTHVASRASGGVGHDLVAVRLAIGMLDSGSDVVEAVDVWKPVGVGCFSTKRGGQNAAQLA